MPRSQHEHEFLADHEDAVEVEFDGEYVYVYEQCQHAPILNSWTDHERDETYTETGSRCEASRTTTLTVSNPIHEETGETVTYDEDYDLWQALMNGENAAAIEERASVEYAGYDPSDATSSVTVETDGEEFRIFLDVEDREVHL